MNYFFFPHHVQVASESSLNIPKKKKKNDFFDVKYSNI